MINITPLNEYAQIKRQIAELEAQLTALKPEVLATLSESGPVAADGYEIKLKSRKQWAYPKTVMNAETRLKAMRLKAQGDGKATCTETSYIECKLKDD
jgi:hypothetical protein